MSNDVMNLTDSNAIQEINDKFKQLDKIKKKVKDANNAANSANDKAVEVSNRNVGLFNKKSIIEDLQESQVCQAEALTKSAEALNVMFEYQEGLTKITSELFFLGCESIATNNYVIKQLESKVKGATFNKMDEMAKTEFLNVIKQLRDRQDVMLKLDSLQNKLKEQNETIVKHETTIANQQNEISFLQAEYNGFNGRIDAAEEKFHLKEKVNADLNSTEDFVERIYVVNEQNNVLIDEINSLKTKNSILLKKYTKFFVISSLIFVAVVSIMILVFVLMYKYK